MCESDSAQADDSFSRDVTAVWHHQKQHHAREHFEGIRISVPISSKHADIEWYLHACSLAFITHF